MENIDVTYLIISLLIMAGITYLLRVLPAILFRKPIKNQWVQSFLYYVPYAVLTAMTFPSIFTATNSLPASIVGTVVAIVVAFIKGDLLLVACSAAGSALIVSLIV